MFRRVALVLMCLFLVQGLAPLQFQEARCTCPCEEEGQGEDCQPDCALLACCTASQILLAAAVAAPLAPGPGRPASREVPDIRSSADPSRIFHVPKPFSA